MSYDIIYEQLALRVPLADVEAQMRQFLMRLDFKEVDVMTLSRLNQRLYERYQCTLSADLYLLHQLIGSSNLFDTEAQKRARSWQFCGVDTFHHLLIQFGCDWASSAESGCIKLYGRNVKGEGWIRSMRQLLINADDFHRMPFCSRLEVWVRAPQEDARQVAFDALKRMLSDLDAKWCERTRLDETGYEVSIRPRSAFEMWLFQQLVYRYQGKCWINGTEPPYGVVKKRAI